MKLTKDTARLKSREWDRLKALIQESPEFDAEDTNDVVLLLKVEWHCQDTYDLPGGE